MAIGLIKKQIIHSSGSKASPARFLDNIFSGKGNKRRLASAEADYKKEMGAYRNMEYKNPYAKNIYAGMENTMEDLTVNQQQAQFQAQQSQQSQANILQSLQGGGSFNAGNIQALANQGTAAAQQASASIGQQESRNQGLQAQEASRLQSMERQGMGQVQSGEAALQQMNADRQATMLGMSMQQVGNAQQAIAANKAMWGSIIGGVASAFTGGVGNTTTNVTNIPGVE
tara:strand:- start:4408 stop:5091 length:684 start_codon:yes stop_codon:yes gene_type:complete